MFLLNYSECLFALYVVFMYCYGMCDKFVQLLIQIDTDSYRILDQK